MLNGPTKKWNRRRKLLFLNICIGGFIFGISLFVYYPTEYYYLKDYVKVDDPDLYYGVSWICLYGSGSVSSLLGSFYMDRTKNLRELCIVINILNIIGNIMYMLYYSPYIVLVGQILIGSGAARNVAGFGEIPRLYEASEITIRLSVATFFGSLGMVVAPSLTFLFEKIDFSIGSFQVNIGNVVGLFMAILNALQLILNLITMSNVSKEYNVKELNTQKSKQLIYYDFEETKNEEKETLIDENVFSNSEEEAKSFKKKYLESLKLSLKNKHVAFLYFFQFMIGFSTGTLTLLEPVKSSSLLGWDQPDLAKYIILCLAVGAIPASVLLIIMSKCLRDYYIFIIGVFISLVPLLMMTFMPLITKQHSNFESIVYFYGIGTTRLAEIIILVAILKTFLAKMVPENIQTVTEAIRNCLYEFSLLIAGLTIKFSVAYMTVVLMIMFGVMTISLMWFLFQKKIFMKL